MRLTEVAPDDRALFDSGSSALFDSGSSKRYASSSSPSSSSSSSSLAAAAALAEVAVGWAYSLPHVMSACKDRPRRCQHRARGASERVQGAGGQAGEAMRTVLALLANPRDERRATLRVAARVAALACLVR